MAAKKSKKSSAKSSRTSSRKSARKPAARRTRAQGPKPRTVTPYLAVSDAANALEWYKRAFGAKETNRQLEPSGKIMHASLQIGDSMVMLSDIFPGSEMRDPRIAGPSVNMHIFSKNIDNIWRKAVEAGATVTMPLEDQFWGDRYGKLADPFGHSWGFSWPAKMTAAQKEAKRVEAMRQMGQGTLPGQ